LPFSQVDFYFIKEDSVHI